MVKIYKYKKQTGIIHLLRMLFFFSRKTNISYSLKRKCMCAYQGVKNVTFSENFAYALNDPKLWLSVNYIVFYRGLKNFIF